MLDPADILVDRHPVIDRLPIKGRWRPSRAEAQEVPRRFEEGVEGMGFARRRLCGAREVPRRFEEGGEDIGFAPRRLAAARAWDMLPCPMVIERIARHREVDIL